MKITELNITKKEAYKELWPLIKGNIIHLTSFNNAEKILKDGMIRGDNMLHRTHPQSINNYGRTRNLICLFDLRNSESQEMKDAFVKFNVLNPSYIDSPHYFIMGDQIHKSLIDWTVAQKECGFSESYIPYIECWHEKDIRLTFCQELIRVNFIWDGDLNSLSDAQLNFKLMNLKKQQDCL